MSNTNFPTSSTSPSTGGYNSSNKSPNNKNILIGVLAAALLGSWGYMLYNKNKTKETYQTLQTQSQTYLTERDSLNIMLNNAEIRLDSITGANHNLQSEMDGAKSDMQKEIAAKKAEIKRILSNQNATASELKKARTLIAELNDKITTLETEVARLTGENEQLVTNNTQLQSEKQVVEENLRVSTEEKQVLAETVDVGSTFTASNIMIQPINEKRGGKEKETITAKKVDKLLVSFSVENRIAKAGNADMYIIVTTPDGKVITDAALNSGTFSTRNDGEKTFTAKTSVDYETGVKKAMQFSLKQKDFATGNYKIEIYHNGFKIADAVRNLKKGGLFG